MDRFFPAWAWLRSYRRNDFKGDLSAGLIVGVMLVPQGMAYALIAGLPPVMGLYASILPPVLYALWGSSRHLAVGPEALLSLMVFSQAAVLAEPKSEGYIALVLLLTLMVAVLQSAMGLLRLGFVTNFLSHAVISGFASAGAIIILLSQLKHLLGIPLTTQESPFLLVGEVFNRLGETNAATLALGSGSILVLAIIKKWAPKFPGSLLVVVVATLLVYGWRLDRFGVSTVGVVPRGLPGFSLPPFEWASLGTLFPAALTIVFVGFMESFAIAQLIAAKEHYKVNADQELRALGLANLGAALFSGYPVIGGFSRSVVNYQAGARSGLASFITAGVIILTLLFLTPLFFYLPKAVLGAIIVVAVSGLINIKEARRLFQIKAADGWILVLTFAAVLVVGVERGILAGAAFSLLLFIWRSAHPHMAELGYLEQEEVFRNVDRFPQVKVYPEVIILRVDASLYFANMRFVEARLRRGIEDRPKVRWILVDLTGVNDIDGVALDSLEELMETYRERGITFAFAGMKGPVRDLVSKAGWTEKYDHINYVSVQQALRGIGIWHGDS